MDRQFDNLVNRLYKIVALDYDGVLMRSSISRKISEKSFEYAISKGEKEFGVVFPSEFRKYSYSNLNKLRREYPEIFSYYLKHVEDIIKSDESIRIEKKRMDAILKFVDERCKPDEKVVVTANFAAEVMLKALGYYDMKVIIVDGENYISTKSEAIRILREERKREKGEVYVVYIGDTFEDALISVISGVRFIDVERILNEIEKNLYNFREDRNTIYLTMSNLTRNPLEINQNIAFGDVSDE
jgi:phosphoglycolate phosphatase-like HAD superfamily hydrolase